MGTKNNPGQYDCFANAEPDEPMFILLARDPHAAFAVRSWAMVRRLLVAMGVKPTTDLAIVAEAEVCAHAMLAWRQENRPNAGRAFDPGPEVHLPTTMFFDLTGDVEQLRGRVTELLAANNREVEARRAAMSERFWKYRFVVQFVKRATDVSLETAYQHADACFGTCDEDETPEDCADGELDALAGSV